MAACEMVPFPTGLKEQTETRFILKRVHYASVIAILKRLLVTCEMIPFPTDLKKQKSTFPTLVYVFIYGRVRKQSISHWSDKLN